MRIWWEPFAILALGIIAIIISWNHILFMRITAILFLGMFMFMSAIAIMVKNDYDAFRSESEEEGK